MAKPVPTVYRAFIQQNCFGAPAPQFLEKGRSPSRTQRDFCSFPRPNRITAIIPSPSERTDKYVTEYVRGFVEKWDELIDWSQRAKSEGRFFIDVLKARGKKSVLDVATGTGFHSVQLLKAGFDVTSADGSAEMLAKAFENGCQHHVVLKTIHADWRWLNKGVQGKFDAIICLGNSFTHLFDENDRRRALAEFYAALKHDGILILDQRNYDRILDEGFASKHKYYYCGDQVVAEPVHVDEGLARFEYAFPGRLAAQPQHVPVAQELHTQAPAPGGLPANPLLRRLPGRGRGDRPRLLHPRRGEELWQQLTRP